MEENDNQNDNEKPGGNTQIAGGGQVIDSAPPAAPSAGEAKAKGPTSSDKYQNLNDYLKANEGNGFGESFSNKVNEDVNKGTQAINNAGTQFKSQVDASTVNNNQALINSAISDPAAFNEAENFKKLRDASYGGPNSFSDSSDLYSKTYGQTKKAQDAANAAGSEGGRFALLDSYFGRPQYNTGQKSLDNLLVQNNSNAQQGIAQARQNANEQRSQFQRQSAELSDYASQGRGTTEATRRAARSALGIDDAGNLVEGQGAIGGALNTLNDELAARKAQAQADVQGFQGLRNQRNLSQLTPEQLSLLGITESDITQGYINSPQFLQNQGIRNIINPMYGVSGAGQFYGANPYQYVSGPMDNELNMGNVATAQEAAKLRALQDLAGLQNPLVQGLENAGKYSTGNLAQFNKSQFIGDVQTRQQAYLAEAQSLADKIQADITAGRIDGNAGKNSFQSQLSSLKQKYGVA